MDRHHHNTSRLPAAIGPYSHAVIAAGKLLFTSGILGMKQDGTFAGTTVEEQARQACHNLRMLLDSASTSPQYLVKTTIYLKNMDHFTIVNEIYGELVSAEPPARSTVEVSRLPKDALIEIDAVAVVPV